jgi:hypothetical protein
MPKLAGTARKSAGLQEMEEDEGEAGRVLPATHVAQAPEQAALVRPARSPKVPAGHAEHAAAPANE